MRIKLQTMNLISDLISIWYGVTMVNPSSSPEYAWHEDYDWVLQEQNPWHLDGKVPDASARSVMRPLAKSLWRRLKTNQPRRFQLVLGPRRVGKSTSLYQTVRALLADGVQQNHIWWLRLDHPILVRASLGILVKHIAEQVNATASRPAFIFLDELTYARDWDLWLKTFYDESLPVVIAGSSSSTAILRNRRLESGVGRWGEQYLAPYLFGEYLDLVGHSVPIPVQETAAKTIEAAIDAQIDSSLLHQRRRRFLLTGGFPELLLDDKYTHADEQSLLIQSQEMLRIDAVERAIYKDIPQAYGVDNPAMIERLLYTFAGQFTGILSPNKICGEINGLSLSTFDRYLGYLEHSFLVFELPNYSGRAAPKLKRGRKLFFVDGSVRNAVLQRGLMPLNNDQEMGLLLENMAAGHLHALGQQSHVRVYYWRDGDLEVDLIYDHPEFPMAFEIGLSPNHSRLGLHALMERHTRFRGRCYFVRPQIMARKPHDSPDNIGTIPLDLFLLAVSAQAERELANRLGRPADEKTE